MKEKDNSDKKALVSAGLGAGILAGHKKVLGKAYEKSLKGVMKDRSVGVSDNKEIYDRLSKKAKKEGIRVIKDPEFDNSAYLGMAKFIRDMEAKMHKKSRKAKSKESKELLSSIAEGIRQGRSVAAEHLGLNENSSKHLGKHSVVMGAVGGNSSAVLSHELGHAKYGGIAKSKNILAKTGHKLSGVSSLALGKINDSKVAKSILAADGFRRGKNSVTEDKDGNIKIKKSKALKSAAIGAAITAPILIAEGSASLRGLSQMRKAGASKELMKAARKDLGSAYGTYLSSSLRPAALELGGHGLGVAYGIRKKKKKEKSKDFSENSDEKSIPIIEPPILDLRKLERKLLESGYSDREIDIVLDELRRIDMAQEDEEELVGWIKTGEIRDPKVLKKMRSKGLDFPAAWIEVKGGNNMGYRIKRFGVVGDLDKKTTEISNKWDDKVTGAYKKGIDAIGLGNTKIGRYMKRRLDRENEYRKNKKNDSLDFRGELYGYNKKK